MQDLALVTVVAEDGLGERAVADLIERGRRNRGGSPLGRDDFAGAWVDALLRLTPRDLRRVNHAHRLAGPDRRTRAPSPALVRWQGARRVDPPTDHGSVRAPDRS